MATFLYSLGVIVKILITPGPWHTVDTAPWSVGHPPACAVTELEERYHIHRVQPVIAMAGAEYTSNGSNEEGSV